MIRSEPARSERLRDWMKRHGLVIGVVLVAVFAVGIARMAFTIADFAHKADQAAAVASCNQQRIDIITGTRRPVAALEDCDLVAVQRLLEARELEAARVRQLEQERQREHLAPLPTPTVSTDPSGRRVVVVPRVVLVSPTPAPERSRTGPATPTREAAPTPEPQPAPSPSERPSPRPTQRPTPSPTCTVVLLGVCVG